MTKAKLLIILLLLASPVLIAWQTQIGGGGSGTGLTASTFAAIPASCTPGTSPLLNVTTSPVGIYYCDGTNHYTNAGLSGSATIRLTDFGVVADAKMNAFCTWSSGSNPVTVTCAATDIPFAASDTGKTCVGPFSGVTVATFTFVSATSGTCSANSTTTAAGNGHFVVYTDNATNVLAAWNTLLAFPRCGTFLLPNGVWANSAPLVNSTVNCSLGPAPSESGGITVKPAAGSSYTSMMFQPPNFNFANCLTTVVPACMFASGGASGVSNQLNLEDFSITGADLNMSSTTCGNGNQYELGAAVNVRIRNVGLLYGFNQCSNNFGQVFLGGGAQTSTIYGFSQFDAWGTGVLISENAPNIYISDLFIGDCKITCTAMQLGSGASVVSNNTQYFSAVNGPSIAFGGAGTFISSGDTLGGGSSVGAIDMGSSNLAFAHLDADNILCSNNPTQCITFRGAAGTGGTISFKNTTGTQTASAFITSSTVGDGFIIDYGGNRFPAGATGMNSFTGSYQVTGPPVFFGKGTGTCTSSVTLFLFPAGQVAATTCTSVAESLLVPTSAINQAGTLRYLHCTATAGGVNGSSGVVTVRKNGANTTITATYGTGTSANDSIHTVAVLQGDIITFSLTTQAAETLANPSCQVQVN